MNEERFIMDGYVTPNDMNIIGESDSESIQNAVNYAVDFGIRRVLIPRKNDRNGSEKWEIDKAIILRSGIEIVLDNCYIRQVDGVFDNVFRSHITAEEASVKEAQLKDVRIIGRGNAVIDGGKHNGLTEYNCLKDGSPHISRNNMILLLNMKNFVIENISFENQRWWAINLIYAEYGRLSNLRFHCECEYPNLDGIDLRDGCHDIIIENINNLYFAKKTYK
jgi:polygalacturonase